MKLELERELRSDIKLKLCPLLFMSFSSIQLTLSLQQLFHKLIPNNHHV
jgi:hypothetical protein